MEAGQAEEKWRNIGAAKTLYRKATPLFESWNYSPLGRYGLEINEMDVGPLSEFTGDVAHRYYICNMETGSWTEYKSNTGVFKPLEGFYWLSEDKLVVTDFSSRISGCLRQHIMDINHNTKEVNCNITRSYRWNVDETHEYGGTNSNAVDYNGDAYIAITGYSEDQLELIRCRLLPFNPLSLKPPMELVIHNDAIRNTLENDARFYCKLQPLCHGSRLIFRLSEDRDYPVYPLPHEFFTIDLTKVQLDRDRVARIEMPEASLGLLKLPALDFDPKRNKLYHDAWNNAEYIINCYEFEGDESSEDASDSDSEPASEEYKCEIFIANLRESSIVRMSFAMKCEVWLTIHPSGALLHWRKSEDDLLQCLNRPRPLCRAPSLFNLSKQRLLMTDSHQPDDKFINRLLFG